MVLVLVEYKLKIKSYVVQSSRVQRLRQIKTFRVLSATTVYVFA